MMTLETLESRTLFSAAPGDIGPDPVPEFTTNVRPETTVVLDINNDGADDLLITRAKRLQLFMNNGAGVFSKTAEIVLKGPVGKVAVGEFVTEGELSIASAGSWQTGRGTQQGVLRVLRVSSDFTRFEVVDRRAMRMLAVHSILAVEASGDTPDEIVVGGTRGVTITTQSAEIYAARVFNGRITGLRSSRPFDMATQPIANFDGLLTALGARDTNEDGRDDLVLGVYSLRNDVGSVIRLASNVFGNRPFGSATLLASPATEITSISFAQAAGDSRVDIVASYAVIVPTPSTPSLLTTKGVAVIAQSGSGWATPLDIGFRIPDLSGLAIVGATSEQTSLLSVSDLNNDGIADFVIQQRSFASYYPSPRQLEYREKTSIFAAISGSGGSWTASEVWSRNYGGSSPSTSNSNFGVIPPTFVGPMRLTLGDIDPRLVGWAERTIFSGPSIAELVAGVLP